MTAILAIHAHPDDLETLAAGTLALLAGAGLSVTVATLTAGECGSTEQAAAETARIRLKEAATAAGMIGASYHCLGFGDLEVFNDGASRRRVTRFIRKVGPQVVLTAAPADYHPDHEAASALVRDACFASSVPNYAAGEAPPLAAVPHLYFTDPIGGRDRDGRRVVPDFGVDIGSVIETKKRMLAAHRSQARWLAQQHGVDDPLGSMEAWARRRGGDFGATFAEGFRHYRGEPFPRSPLLQTWLGAVVRMALPGSYRDSSAGTN